MRALNNCLILSLITLACAACGVRGALTVNPPPVKGLPADNASPATLVSAAIDLRLAPAAGVLYSADGKKTIIPPPESK